MSAQTEMLLDLIENSEDEALVEAAQAKLAELRAGKTEEQEVAEAELAARLVDAEIRARARPSVTVVDGVRNTTHN